MTTKKGGLREFNWDLKTGYKPIQWRSTVSAPSCAFCNKAVFPAEEVIGAGQKYHKLCLKCSKSSYLFFCFQTVSFFDLKYLSCPFCQRGNYSTVYTGPLTKEEREKEAWVRKF